METDVECDKSWVKPEGGRWRWRRTSSLVQSSEKHREEWGARADSVPNLCFYISLCLPLNEPVPAPQRARLGSSRRRALDRLSRRKASLGGFVSRTNLNTLAESYNLIYAPMVVLLRLNKAWLLYYKLVSASPSTAASAARLSPEGGTKLLV